MFSSHSEEKDTIFDNINFGVKDHIYVTMK